MLDIAAVMYVSIVATALILHYSFALFGITPETARAVQEVAQFKLDYTFWMNLAALGMVAAMLGLNRAWHRRNEAMAMDMGGGLFKKIMARVAVAVLTVGLALHLYFRFA